MDFLQKWIQMYCFIHFVKAAPFAAVNNSTYEDIPMQFCGYHLANFLSCACLHYNHPPSTESLRFKREIVDECCIHPCTLAYVTEYYCEESRETTDCFSHITEPQNNENYMWKPKRSNEIVPENMDTQNSIPKDASDEESNSDRRVRKVGKTRSRCARKHRKMGRRGRKSSMKSKKSRNTIDTHLTDSLHPQHSHAFRCRTKRRRRCSCRKHRAKHGISHQSVSSTVRIQPAEIGIVDNSERPVLFLGRPRI